MPDKINSQSPEQGFVTWDDAEGRHKALADVAESIDYYEGVQKSVGYGYRNFIDIEPNRSVRTGFQRSDYNRFRAAESVPQKQIEAIKMCMDAYDRVGIIRNVIDLMGDFACQGISLVHPNKTIERFYKKWFEKVQGKDRSERFLNTFYRCGNVVVKRRTAKLNARMERKMRKGLAVDTEIQEIKVKRREIPWTYDFLNPVSIEVLGSQLSSFVGEKRYAIRVSKIVRGYISNPSTDYRHLLSQLPPDLMKKIQEGENLVPLDPDKISVHHYKKDDWLVWANPMIFAILDDILMLEKMKLADLAALDGAISNIRLWKLGSLEEKILPTKAAINKLRNILASNVGGGTMDLVWGPELDFKESSTQVFRFLGKEKYEPVLTNIYAGLGIPPTLTGMASAGGGGFTNNFVSLKTLVERLQYGRNALVGFWNEEIERVQKAMGFRFPAKVHFDQMVLSDEASEKNLLVQLADRDLISTETLLERFGEIPDIERIRIRREMKVREEESIPQKAGPYHNPQHRNDLEKIALTKDAVSPEDLGIVPSDETGKHPFTKPDDRRSDDKIEEKKEEVKDKQDERDQKKFDQQQERQKEFEPKGRPEDGRPKNAKDQQKRKQKEVKPKNKPNFVNSMLWANNAQKEIASLVQPALLAHYGKKNVRSLTKSQMDELEYIKLCLLCGLTPFADINVETIKDMLDNNVKPHQSILDECAALELEFASANERHPSIDEIRQIQSSAYAKHHSK